MTEDNRSFPNKAGDHTDTDDILRAELEAAGIYALRKPRSESGEVKTSIAGALYDWRFKRSWYYWVCKGPGIEVEAAERLHAVHGKDVRVAGHCGCPSPREWYKGKPVTEYHVDSPKGLKALADCIEAEYYRRIVTH